MEQFVTGCWTSLPLQGMQVRGYNNAQEAFKYAEKEYMPYGYNVAYFSTDIKLLVILKK